ncbi:hypothetical protein AYI70_g5066 [Smittium culicis]|uniref:Ankyrin repeat protein n=1 Tax=Smittium culicis TaxID=133412 RepID=A0A1R1XW66_9FUNG|nr:hypothetical protein AYI70_g9213 [Smittium culicis]OMJ18903.1 hypothetical protein AYI70_g5066 [Smittium culicis]
MELVNWLLGNGADFTDPEGRAFEYACARNNYDLVKKIMDSGFRVNASNFKKFDESRNRFSGLVSGSIDANI